MTGYRIQRLTALAACGLLLTALPFTTKASDALQIVPPMAGPEIVVSAEPIPAPAPLVGMPTGAVRPVPKVNTHVSRSARRMLAHGHIELLMVTQNPADGCLYEIPMCIPACCVGEPIVKSRRGLFGRGIVEYCWPNGFTATVIFRHVRGDVKVAYAG